jgi:GNAT superfamily N-acetyltransferase
MTRARAPRIIRRRPEHDDEIFTLYAEIFGPAMLERSRARWRWQYLDNPHAGDDGPVIWLAVDDGRLLGQMATMPFPMWWGDREVRASAGMDYFVRKEAQGRGLGIALSEAWADHVDVALALGLTPSSYPLFRKIFTDVGPVPAYVKPLDATAIARRRWGRVPGAVVGPAIAVGLSVFGPRVRTAPGTDVREVDAFGEEYDDLWMRARGSFPAIVRRDARFLTWKFLQCPFRDYRVLEARERGALTGYAILRQEGEAPFRRGVIVDLFCASGDTAAQDALIAAALDRFREERLARAETYSLNVRMGAAFRRHGFRPGRTGIQYCVAYRHASDAPLARAAEFALTLGDGDLDRA